MTAAPDSTALPLVGVILGSRSDLETLSPACEILRELEVPFETQVVSAHRTPDRMFEYASSAEGRGLLVIIAGGHATSIVAASAKAKLAK